MSPSRDDAQTMPNTLPPSVEEAYRRKCIALRSRMREVEEANDQYRLRRERLARGIRKMRLERAILLETLAKRMNKKGPTVLEGSNNADFMDPETDDSTDAPPTPQERPMRIKRPHRRTEGYGDVSGSGYGDVERGGMLPGEGMMGDFVGRGEEGDEDLREEERLERKGEREEGKENGRLDEEHEHQPTRGTGGEERLVESGQQMRYAAEGREVDAGAEDPDESMQY